MCTFRCRQVSTMSEEGLREKLQVVCTSRQLIMGEAWVQKVLQLKQVSEPRVFRETSLVSNTRVRFRLSSPVD